MYKNQLNKLKKFSSIISILGIILLTFGLLQILPLYGPVESINFNNAINILSISGLLLLSFGFILKKYNLLLEELHYRLWGLESRKDNQVLDD